MSGFQGDDAFSTFDSKKPQRLVSDDIQFVYLNPCGVWAESLPNGGLPRGDSLEHAVNPPYGLAFNPFIQPHKENPPPALTNED